MQMAVQDFYNSGERMAVRITLPNNGGVLVQLGTIQQTSEQASRGSNWTGQLTIRNTGRRVDFD